MAAKYPQPDGRGISPRKWSALKTGGPLIYFAERVLKRLIQHGYPASYDILPCNRLFPVRVRFVNELGETPSFLQCLADCVHVISQALRARGALADCVLSLVGDWELLLSGVNPPKADGSSGGRWKKYAGETLPGKPDSARLVRARDCPF